MVELLLSILSILALIVVTVIEVIFGKGKKIRKFFYDAGIRYLRPHTLYENIQDFIFKKKHLGKDIYEAFPNEKYVGFYEMMSPWIVVRDPKIAKMLLNDEFSKFSSRSDNMPVDIEPLLGNALLFMKDLMLEIDCSRILKPLFLSIFASLAFGVNLDVSGNNEFNRTFIRLNKSQNVLIYTVAVRCGDHTAFQDWDINDLTSQAVTVLLSGSDTSASTMGFIIRELAMQPAIQRKLKEEIDQITKVFGPNPPSQVIHSMGYMNMVFLETLRKWPQTTVSLERICQEDFILPPPRENAAPVKVDYQGIGVMVSVYGIHRDADYWKNPETFDPDRFNKTNIKNIKPFTYIPFGIGPRSCVGKNLGTKALKMTLFHFMSKFEFVKIAQSTENLHYDCESMTFRPGSNWIGFKLRT